ncbi:MAG: cystathionine beta-lyase [Bacteroidetes bacterium GWF2_41_61]|nr:MAG: cystathionine beta-lyase [Bacteroidetes bacterium GWF2_41_61]HBG24342.1 cystathionine beta-lyase [Rikenellaceae bacterium]
MFDFDKVVDRRGSSCFKYDARREVFGREDILPMWVADMDFQSPPCVIDAARRLCDLGVFGYTYRSRESKELFIQWVLERYGWEIGIEQLSSSPGIVAALPVAIIAFTSVGDKILIQTPVYPPFHAIVKENGRELICSPLKIQEDGYVIDWENFESKLAGGVKMFIMSNSHNPIGKVWSYDELKKMGELCCKYGVLIFSDDIHADLALYGNRHTIMAAISHEIAMNTITAMAPSKTFNIAGMLNSVIIAENDEILKRFDKELNKLHLGLGNIFGHITMEAAYRDGGPWLEELLRYLERNIDFAYDFIKAEVPGVNFFKPQSSFLLWLDFRGTGLPHKEVANRLLNDAKLGLNDGLTFGPDGEGFFRMNIGTPLSVVQDGMERLRKILL